MPKATEKTFRQLVPDFLRWHRSRCNNDSMVYLVRVLERYFGDMAFTAMTVPVIEDFIAQRVESGRKTTTINRGRAALSIFFEWCMARDLHPGPNPIKRVRKFRESPGKTRYLTPTEAQKLVDAAAPHLKPILMTSLYTGGRIGEVLKLRPCDIDFDAALVTFRKETAKSGVGRSVPLHPRLAAALRELPQEPTDAPMFQYVRGVPILSIRTAFYTARRKAGIGRDVSPHTLRHSFASLFVQAGGDLFRLQRFLGHSSVSLTQRYSHLSPDFLAAGLQFITGPTAAADPKHSSTLACRPAREALHVRN